MTTEHDPARVEVMRLEAEIEHLEMACTGYVREIERLRRDLKEWESGARLVAATGVTVTLVYPADLTPPPAGTARWRVKFVDEKTGTRIHFVNGHTTFDAYERTCRTPGIYPPSFGACEIRRVDK